MKGVSNKGWMLLAISSSVNGTLSPVQLQKSLFIFGQEKKKEVGSSFYKFDPYHYGPFSQAIYTDAAALDVDGYIQIVQIPSRSWPEYTITKAGLDKASELREVVPKKDYKYLSEVVNWAKSLSFADLLRAIYEQYPAFKKNSVFQG